MSFESSYSLEATVFSYLAAFDDWRVCLSHFVAKGRGEWLMSRVSLAQVFCLACLGVAVAAFFYPLAHEHLEILAELWCVIPYMG